MTQSDLRRQVGLDDAKVLVMSMSFAPCEHVGGKRFSYLSKFLFESCGEYHVVARRERDPAVDSSAFRNNVHRVRMFPYFPRRHKRGIRGKLARFWARWLSVVDPYIGWVIPATVKSLRLSRRCHFNIVIVTVPFFSALIAGLLVAKLTRSRLIIDYRDEWTNLEGFSKRFGENICRWLERSTIKFASAVVVCTDRMRSNFVRDFGGIAPARVSTIYNGFEEGDVSDRHSLTNSPVTMLYAGNFYGARRISMVADALAKLRREGFLSKETFQFHLYSRLDEEDATVIEAHDIGDLVKVHEPVAYQTIKEIMKRSDILFLPSGVEYAVPFKFFDYLSARRPVFAVASKESAVYDLMSLVDCGEFAEIGCTDEIASALSTLINRRREYRFSGSDQYLWRSAASKYSAVISDVLNQ